MISQPKGLLGSTLASLGYLTWLILDLDISEGLRSLCGLLLHRASIYTLHTWYQSTRANQGCGIQMEPICLQHSVDIKEDDVKTLILTLHT